MIGSHEPAHWVGPPTRLCFLESLEVAPSGAGHPGSHGSGAIEPWVPASGFPAGDGRSELGLRVALTVKRGIDVFGGLIGLLGASVVIFGSALAIWCSDRGPVFFRQKRCGQDGRTFWMWKLRTMVPDAEARLGEVIDQNQMDGPVFKCVNDPRTTDVGRLLRRFSLDELPQFWNVIKGDMSLVGPRPPLPDEVAHYTPYERRRLAVRPGLTCTWQVSGRNSIPFDEWVRLDLDYIDHWSLRRDLTLIAKTIPAMLQGDGAS